MTPEQRYQSLVKSILAVKLPRPKVDALVESGDGERFDAGKGRPMAECFALSPTSRKRWLALSEEAIAFVQTS